MFAVERDLIRLALERGDLSAESLVDLLASYAQRVSTENDAYYQSDQTIGSRKANPYSGALTDIVRSVIKQSKRDGSAVSVRAMSALFSVFLANMIDPAEIQEMPAVDMNLLAKQPFYDKRLYLHRTTVSLWEDMIAFTGTFQAAVAAGKGAQGGSAAAPAVYRLGRTLGRLIAEMWLRDKEPSRRSKVFAQPDVRTLLPIMCIL